MESKTKHSIHQFLLALLYALIPLALMKAQTLPVDSILRVLDKEMELRSHYEEQNEQRLAALKQLLHGAIQPSIQFEQCSELFKEYESYQFDSAYVYAKRSLSIARQMGDSVALAKAHRYVARCYIGLGTFYDAIKQLDSIPYTKLPIDEQIDYYTQCVYLYQSMANYLKGTSDLNSYYQNKADAYRQWLRENNTRSTIDYIRNNNMAIAHIDSLPLAEKNAARERYLRDFNLSLHEQAVQYCLMGEAAEKLGHRQEAIAYTALSAICDIRSSTRETSASQTLAGYLYEEKQIARAVRYIHMAQEDADFFNTKIRRMEINQILPRIENRRYDWISSQRTALILGILLVASLLILVIWMALRINLRNHKLAEARREIANQASELRHINEALSQSKQRLEEANEIRDQYIIQSLYSDSTFVNRVEELCKVMDRKLKAKQYADLSGFTAMMGIRKERERMTIAFDQAFLKLFPNFPEAYNDLFDEENRILFTPDAPMPTEVRIFALMRLGIEEISVVSRYLNLSPNSIYVYKAKVKAKARVSKEEFEMRIKQIPKP